MTLAEDARRMADDPARFFGGSGRAAHHMGPSELVQLQRSAVEQRFESLRPRLSVLKAVAEEQRIEGLESLSDVAHLLFPHTVYKSYPVSLLDNARYAQLTKWLSRLTTCELGHVSVSECDGIDSWLEVLDRHTDLRVAHTSGTTGTMSFLPRARAEYEAFFRTQRMGVLEFVDPEERLDHRDEFFEVVWPTYSAGRSGLGRSAEFFRDYLAGGQDRFHPLIKGAISADVMFLAARLRSAAASGESAKVRIAPSLMARRTELEQTQRAVKCGLGRLFEDVISRLEGKRVFLIGLMATISEIASAGLARNLRKAFAPGSIVQTGGGSKGALLPPHWEQDVKAFSGVSRIAFNYGMTELTMSAYLCEQERYHIPPWIVLFVLDPNTGVALPRAGAQTGRAAYFDLLPQTYWGGFVTGDEVNVDWALCPCGRTTPHISRHIERFTEKRGGDDKITCAATEDAHQAALEILRERLS